MISQFICIMFCLLLVLCACSLIPILSYSQSSTQIQNKRGALLTFYYGAQKQFLGTLLETSKREYCDRHDMVYLDMSNNPKIHTRGNTFNDMMMLKPQFILEAFQRNDIDWAWFLDGDALINNMDVDIRTFLPSRGCATFTANGAFYQNTFGFVNTGSFLVQNTECGKDFLRAWLQFQGPTRKKTTQCTYWNENEQSRYICLLNENVTLRDTIDHITHTCINSEFPWLASWDDFVVHFAGGNKLQRFDDFVHRRTNIQTTESCITDQSYWNRTSTNVQWPNAFFS